MHGQSSQDGSAMYIYTCIQNKHCVIIIYRSIIPGPRSPYKDVLYNSR